MLVNGFLIVVVWLVVFLGTCSLSMWEVITGRADAISWILQHPLCPKPRKAPGRIRVSRPQQQL